MTAISISLDDVRMLSLLITLILFPVYITTDSTPTQCEAVGKYKVLHYESCSKYYLCVNGEVLETGCFPILRRYNNATQSCQWFWQTPCETSPPAPSLNLTLPDNAQPHAAKKTGLCL
ncbi:uncharacterized protein LOC142322990 isoform X2 [Lycorma delicatula]|uniref:uncharacterized protein LOC142322990 isoform X2 n=1 Tax=Lycorma delicatula TaxID=130591 RepID=UPI003F518237